MDALKKAEKEKKEAAKRRQADEHPGIDVGNDDNTQTLNAAYNNADFTSDEEPTQEASIAEDDTVLGESTHFNEEFNTTTQTINRSFEDSVLSDSVLGLDEDDTILPIGDNEIDLDLDVEDTHLISDMTDESIIERTIEATIQESESERLFDEDMTDELKSDMVIEDNLSDDELGLKLETIETLDSAPESSPQLELEEQSFATDMDVERSQEQDVIQDDYEEEPLSEDQTLDKKSYNTGIGQITEPSWEFDALGSGSVTQMLRDIGSHDGQPTPVSASTVFAASKSTNWVNRIFIGLSAALGLLVLIAAGLFIQYQITPDVPKVLSPSVAIGVEARKEAAITSLQDLAKPKDDASGSSIIESVKTDEAIETQYINHDDVASNSPESVATLSEPVSEPAVENEETPVNTVDDTSPVVLEDASEVSSTTINAQKTVANLASSKRRLPEAQVEEVVFSPTPTAVAPSMIKISKSNKTRPEQNTIKRAYAAFQTGDYDIAQSFYKLSLEKAPDNRDALLGLAAIELKQGNPQTAYKIYQTILKLNPKDPVAQVSIMNLQSQFGAGSLNESKIHHLIQESPNDANLYFSLGTLYSKQQRWPEAQQAFFDAFTRQAKNPIYALNLAISLDHLRQPKAALNYYETALSLAEAKSANFDIQAVQDRIDALRQNQN